MKEEAFREETIEGEMNWLEDQLFKTCCPGVAYRPSSALSQVKQLHQDTMGNITRVPMQLYISNVLTVMNCMGRQDYEIDVVMYTVNNMDPDVKAELLTSYDKYAIPSPKIRLF